MITEDYVSFETAKLLKDKGFNEPCLYYYFSDGIIGRRKGLKDRNCPSVNTFSMPTYQMAMKWLREVYNIHIVLSPNKKMNNQYCSIIFVDKDGELHPQPTDFFHGSYKETAEAAIKYCLENLI